MKTRDCSSRGLTNVEKNGRKISSSWQLRLFFIYLLSFLYMSLDNYCLFVAWSCWILFRLSYSISTQAYCISFFIFVLLNMDHFIPSYSISTFFFLSDHFSNLLKSLWALILSVMQQSCIYSQDTILINIKSIFFSLLLRSLEVLLSTTAVWAVMESQPAPSCLAIHH